MLMAHASGVPTLRKVREGWGTHSFCAGSEIKRVGHPPYPGSYVEYVQKLGREAHGIYS
jgi:hypothetical protein